MHRALPGSDYYADSATPRTHQRTSRLTGHHQRPVALGALPTFTVIRLTGSAAGFTPAAHPGSTRSLSSATRSEDIQTRSEPPINTTVSLLPTTHVRQVWGRHYRYRGF